MKTKITLLTFLCATLFFSCKKGDNCDKATVIIKNNTSTTIHFAYDTHTYNDSIVPGGTTTKQIGPIKNHFWGAEWPTINFFSDHGDHEYLIKKCDVEEDIN